MWSYWYLLLAPSCPAPLDLLGIMVLLLLLSLPGWWSPALRSQGCSRFAIVRTEGPLTVTGHIQLAGGGGGTSDAAPHWAFLAAVPLLRHDKVMSVWSGDLLITAGEGLCWRLGICCFTQGRLTHPVLVRDAWAPQVMLRAKVGHF